VRRRRREHSEARRTADTENINPLIYREISVRTCGSIVRRGSDPKPTSPSYPSAQLVLFSRLPPSEKYLPLPEMSWRNIRFGFISFSAASPSDRKIIGTRCRPQDHFSSVLFCVFIFMYICDLPLSIVHVRALLSRLAAREIYARYPLSRVARV